MTANRRKRAKTYRVMLFFPGGLSRSVFVSGKNRRDAEKHALAKYPSATGVDRHPGLLR